ncbi:hypothetical protein D3C72_2317660 [compost metagenome]
MLAQAKVIIAGEIAELTLFADEKAACAALHDRTHAKSLCRPAFLQRSCDALLPGHTVAAL